MITQGTTMTRLNARANHLPGRRLLRRVLSPIVRLRVITQAKRYTRRHVLALSVTRHLNFIFRFCGLITSLATGRGIRLTSRVVGSTRRPARTLVSIKLRSHVGGFPTRLSNQAYGWPTPASLVEAVSLAWPSSTVVT